MIYNYPGAQGGLDMDSTVIVEIAKENPNICGVKLTCGAVGKLTRITAGTATESFKQFPRASEAAPEFITLGGFADFLLPTVAGGRAHGAIMGLANIFPNAIARIMEIALEVQSGDVANIKEGLELQDLCAGADAVFAAAGIAGTKWWLEKHNGYPSRRVRRPLLERDDEAGKALEADEVVKEFYAVEQKLAKAKALS